MSCEVRRNSKSFLTDRAGELAEAPQILRACEEGRNSKSLPSAPAGDQLLLPQILCEESRNSKSLTEDGDQVEDRDPETLGQRALRRQLRALGGLPPKQAERVPLLCGVLARVEETYAAWSALFCRLGPDARETVAAKREHDGAWQMWQRGW